MNGYNSVTLLGTICSDVTIDVVGSKDTPCCKFTVVNNRKFGGKEEAHFFDVVMWGDRAVTFAQHHEKGAPCFVVGELKQEKWKDKATGTARSRLVIHAHTFAFVPNGKRKEAHAEPDRKSNRTNEADLYRSGRELIPDPEGVSSFAAEDVDDTPF